MNWGFRVNQAQADALAYLIPIGLTAAGALSPNPKVWYDCLFELATILCGGMLLCASVWEVLSRFLAVPVGERIQKHKSAPPQYLREALGSTLCMYIVACLSAWPLSQQRRGVPTAFKSSLEEASWGPFPLCFYLIKLLATALVADAWTFWKHYALHNPTLYVFHKSHHVFHDPSTFAGFAIHPFEAVWTFCPILMMCIPQLALYGPLHAPFLGFFGALNLYLHCGYSIPALEWLLPKLLINTSVHHNKHHQLSVTHFGEMLTLWDLMLGTHTGGWSHSQIKEQETRVARGQSGMDQSSFTSGVQAEGENSKDK